MKRRASNASPSITGFTTSFHSILRMTWNFASLPSPDPTMRVLRLFRSRTPADDSNSVKLLNSFLAFSCEKRSSGMLIAETVRSAEYSGTSTSASQRESLMLRMTTGPSCAAGASSRKLLALKKPSNPGIFLIFSMRASHSIANFE